MRKKLGSVMVVFSLAVFFLLNAVSITPAEEAGPFYFSIFGGYVVPQDLEVEGHGALKDIELDDSWAIGAKAGYIIPAVKWLAVELEYSYLANQDIDKGDGDFSAHNAMANLLLRYPKGKLHPYVGGGLGWSWGDFKGKYAGVSFDGDDDALAWQLMAGLKYDITPNFSVDLGYKFFAGEYDVASDGEAKDNIIMLGLNYIFGGEKPTPTVTIDDSDGDGVPNNRDLCPDTPEGAAVDRDGCPVDSDGDGVYDYLDKCPGTPAGVKVDGNGCPLDSDRDGVLDYLDKCPGTPYGTEVDRDGCPPPVMEEALKPAATEEAAAAVREDSDGDGVYDDLDRCPDTLLGIKVDQDGCPLPVTEKVTVRLNVEFDTDKADIKSKYHDEIEKFADFMNRYTDTKAIIEGHTDSIASMSYNQALSERRADSVKQYLVEQFNIDPDRLTTAGYGETRPIGDNATAEGRQLNRRVQAVIETMVEK